MTFSLSHINSSGVFERRTVTGSKEPTLKFQGLRESNERALGTKTSVLTHFVSILRMLYFVYMNICFHWLSFTLKP